MNQFAYCCNVSVPKKVAGKNEIKLLAVLFSNIIARFWGIRKNVVLFWIPAHSQNPHGLLGIRLFKFCIYNFWYYNNNINRKQLEAVQAQICYNLSKKSTYVIHITIFLRFRSAGIPQSVHFGNSAEME